MVGHGAEHEWLDQRAPVGLSIDKWAWNKYPLIKVIVNLI